MTQAHEQTEDTPLGQAQGGRRWTLEAVDQVLILRFAGEPRTTAKISTSPASTQKSGTWWGPRNPLEEAPIPLRELTFDPIHLENRGICIAIGDQLPVQITPSRVLLHLGPTPVVVELEAEAVLSKLPWPELASLMSTIRAWASSAPVKRFKASLISEPEDVGWEEVVVEAFVDADATEALRLWDDLASGIDRAKATMSESERLLFDRHFGIQLVWSDDSLQS